MNDKSDEFRFRLKSLMKEFNATIGFSCKIDNFGETSNDHMIIWIDNKKVSEMPGWSFKSDDI